VVYRVNKLIEPELADDARRLLAWSERSSEWSLSSSIVGSTRKGRLCEKPAHWTIELARRRNVRERLPDTRDYPTPFFDEAATPATPGLEP
jgi:hypothetical protein